MEKGVLVLSEKEIKKAFDIGRKAKADAGKTLEPTLESEMKTNVERIKRGRYANKRIVFLPEISLIVNNLNLIENNILLTHEKDENFLLLLTRFGESHKKYLETLKKEASPFCERIYYRRGFGTIFVLKEGLYLDTIIIKEILRGYKEILSRHIKIYSYTIFNRVLGKDINNTLFLISSKKRKNISYDIYLVQYITDVINRKEYREKSKISSITRLEKKYMDFNSGSEIDLGVFFDAKKQKDPFKTTHYILLTNKRQLGLYIEIKNEIIGNGLNTDIGLLGYYEQEFFKN